MQLEISTRRGLSTVGHTGTWGNTLNACGEMTATDVEAILHSSSQFYESRSPMPLGPGVSKPYLDFKRANSVQ